MKKCFHSAVDCCFILSKDQPIPEDCLLFFAFSVGLTEKFLALISFPNPFGSFEERSRTFFVLFR
jgi:hypothetical protein